MSFSSSVTAKVMWCTWAAFMLNWLALVVLIASGAQFRFILAALLSLPILYGGLWFTREVHQDQRLPWNWRGDSLESGGASTRYVRSSVPGSFES